MRAGRVWTVVLALSIPSLLAGCGDDAPPPAAGGPGSAPPAATPVESLPADLFLAAKPEGAVDVGALKKTAKEGDTVAIRGRIGGNTSPFVGGRAVMTLADPALVPCNEMSMEDACELPWDYCCEDRAVLTAHTATVEVDGADGRPLRVDLKGAGGLEELKTVTVVGTVGPRPDPAVLVVRATGIFLE